MCESEKKEDSPVNALWRGVCVSCGMAEQNKTALIFGASGLIGSYLTDELLNNPHVEKVLVFVRRPLEKTHAKLETILFDYASWQDIASYFTEGSLVFCAVGTTLAKTPDKAVYHGIDYGIPLMLATLSARHQVARLLIVSSVGADAGAKGFYLRTKGEMENAVQQAGVKSVYFFRPSLLLGPRKEMRLGEKIAIGLDFLFKPLLIGKWRRYRGIHAQTVAHAMVTVALGRTAQVFFESEEIAALR